MIFRVIRLPNSERFSPVVLYGLLHLKLISVKPYAYLKLRYTQVSESSSV